MPPKKTPISLPSSTPQVNVASHLEDFRRVYLQQALADAIQSIDLPTINRELDRLAPAKDLQQLASRGVRGEFIYAVPAILAAKPRLLGYYRLLMGYSQKEFYQKSRLARFERMEIKGVLTDRLQDELEDLCRALIQRASEMLNEIGFHKLTLEPFDDLCLLTLGPQLRGSLNTRIGRIANQAVFEIIKQIVAHAVQTTTASRLELLNASGRKVIIAFSADPDISIFEEISAGTLNEVIAIEIKGGADKSNIWNRLGEAEKSHQSAKQRGFGEFWTIDDGRHFLNRCQKQYDAVVLDAFLGDSSPSHLMTREAFSSMHHVLRPGGALVINSFGDLRPGRNFFATSFNQTLKSVFRAVRMHTCADPFTTAGQFITSPQ